MDFPPASFWAPILVALIMVRGLQQARKLPADSPLRAWLGGALAAFVDGFIDGCPVGAPAGAGIAVVDGKVPTDLDAGHLAIGAGHVLLIPVITGLADVRAWKKDHPFPNIFVKTQS